MVLVVSDPDALRTVRLPANCHILKGLLTGLSWLPGAAVPVPVAAGVTDDR